MSAAEWTNIAEQQIPILLGLRQQQAGRKLGVVLANLPPDEAHVFLNELKQIPPTELLPRVIGKVQQLPAFTKLKVYHAWSQIVATIPEPVNQFNPNPAPANPFVSPNPQRNVPVWNQNATPQPNQYQQNYQPQPYTQPTNLQQPQPMSSGTAQNQQNSGLGFLGSVLQNVTALFQPVVEERPIFNVQLSTEQKRQFINQGFIQIENVIDKKLIAKAVAAINQQIGKGIPSGPEAAAFKLVRGGLGYWPELAHKPVILDLLYKSPLATYIEQLVGKYHPCAMGQIALRFPGHSCLHSEEHSDLTNLMNIGRKVNNLFGKNQPDPIDEHDFDTDFVVPMNWRQFWHVDGLPNDLQHAMFPKGSVMQFTLLVGILLTDLPKPLAGNLAVFPGSHQVIQDHINLYNLDPKEVLKTSATNGSVPPIQFKELIHQITGKAGDVILCHYQLAHTVAPNASENIRYAVYFRVHHNTRQQGVFKPAAMHDIWLEYDGIRPLLQ